MQYQTIVSGKVFIEIHNSWQGVETVYANGQIVSQKGSFWGTSHPFTVLEDGKRVQFVLTTKMSNGGAGVAFDLSRNGALVAADINLPYGSRRKSPHLKLKNSGLKKLRDYDLEAALEDFLQAAEILPGDSELYFHMACAHSVLENAREGFNLLARAVETGFRDTNQILTHDMLAFLRLHPAFEDFRSGGFREVKNVYLKLRVSEEEAPFEYG